GNPGRPSLAVFLAALLPALLALLSVLLALLATLLAGVRRGGAGLAVCLGRADAQQRHAAQQDRQRQHPTDQRADHASPQRVLGEGFRRAASARQVSI